MKNHRKCRFTARIRPVSNWKNHASGRVLTTLAILQGWIFCTHAHVLLSENVGIYLDDPSRIRIEFTIHAPELPSAVAEGVDPAAVDDTWLRSLSDDRITELTREADAFIRETFSLFITSKPEIEAVPIQFDTPDQIQHPPADTKLPPGCLLATVWLKNPGPPQALSVGFSPDAQKRMMVSIARPGEFPKVHDVAPGESVAVALPVPPEPDIPALAWWVGLIGMGLAFGALGLWSKRRRNRMGADISNQPNP